MKLDELGREVKVEENEGKYLVDADAYVPTKVRVEQYMAAGRALDEFNRSLSYDDYEDPDAAEEASMDITRSPGFDAADVTRGEEKRSEIIAAVKTAAKKARGSASAAEAAQSGNEVQSNHDAPVEA